MRVLQVTARYYPELQFGGPPQKIHALSHGLVEHGYQVHVVTSRSTRPLAHQRVVIDGVRVEYIPWVGKGAWKLPLGAGKLVSAVRGADIVHCYGLYNLLCPTAAFLARQLGRPFLLEPLGMYVPRARSLRAKRLYHRLFTSWMSRWAAKVIATSTAEIDDLSQLVERERLVLRRNGIDLTLFQDLPSGAPFRASYNIDNDERVILYVGRISPIKNLEQLVHAFHRAALKRTRLILVGPMLESDYVVRLRNLISELNLVGQIVLTGPLYGRDKLAALAAADLFVLPSLFESYGNAAAEAVAAGVPVLLTEGCGIAPLIHGKAGLAVPPRIDALMEGLRLMIEDDEQRTKYTRQRTDILDELSWEKPIKQTQELYETVVRDGTDAMLR